MDDTGIVFIGGRDRGLDCLKNLLKRGEKVLHIFCMPEDEHERDKHSRDIVRLAKQNKIPVTVTKTVDRPEHIAGIEKLKPILIIAMGWRTIIPKQILDIPKRGIVAAHESLLPKGRGFAPVNWAVINGEKQTGVTLFYLNEGMDAGDIIAQKKIKIGKTDTAWDVYQKTKEASIRLLLENFDDIKSGKARRKKQNHKKATYFAARIPEDGKIKWSLPTQKIYNLIRGLSHPYPGAFTFYNGKKIIVQKASLVKNPPNYVGRVPGRVATLGNGWVDVLTGDGVLRIEEMEINGRRVKAREVIASIKGTLI